MNRTNYHLAQVNIGRLRASIDDPLIGGFVARLADINALAEQSPGFVWRLQTEEGNATYLRPFNDERIIVNMSVWESVEALKKYVYKTAHAEVMRQRKEWFENFEGMYLALWWVRAGHLPTVGEAKERLTHLEQHGASAYAFTFRKVYEPTEESAEQISGIELAPCSAG